jgi:LacI family transcriptional regulator
MGSQVQLGAEIYLAGEDNVRDSLLNAMDAGVTGFVCGNDSAALQVIELLERAGLRVPQDASVTGFDGWTTPAGLRQPTTIDACFFDIGKTAARLALQRIARPGDQPCIVSVRGKLKPGETSGPAPEGSTGAGVAAPVFAT